MPVEAKETVLLLPSCPHHNVCVCVCVLYNVSQEMAIGVNAAPSAPLVNRMCVSLLRLCDLCKRVSAAALAIW